MSNETTKTEPEKEASQLLKDALGTLSSVTNGASSTGSDTSEIPEIAAKVIQGSKLVQNDTQGLDDYVYDTWCGIFDLVGKTTSEHQQPIINVLLELRKTTLYPNEETSQKPVSVQGGTIWSDLPTFGWVARDLWNFVPSEKSDPSEVQKWANWTAFLAKLTAISLSDTPEGEPGSRDSLDFSNFALWSLRDAFEDTTTASTDKVNSNAVNLASLWIRHAGKELKVLAEKEVALPQAQGRGGGEFGEREWTGFNADRWAVWKGGFRAFAEVGAGSGSGQTGPGEGVVSAASEHNGNAEGDETRKMAREAAGLM